MIDDLRFGIEIIITYNYTLLNVLSIYIIIIKMEKVLVSNAKHGKWVIAGFLGATIFWQKVIVRD